MLDVWAEGDSEEQILTAPSRDEACTQRFWRATCRQAIGRVSSLWIQGIQGRKWETYPGM